MPVEIQVQSGPHRGARVCCDWADRDRISLGRALACDIVLSLSDLPDHALTLIAQDTGLLLRAVEADLTLSGRGLLPSGMEIDVESPFEVTIGETVLHFGEVEERAAEPAVSTLPPRNEIASAPATRFTSPLRQLGPVTAMLAGFGGAFLYHFISAIPVDGSPRETRSGPAMEQVALAADTGKQTSQVPDRTVELQEAQKALVSRITAISGLDRLTVIRRDDALFVEGEIDETKRGEWLRVRHWFDRVHGPNVALRSHARFVAPSAPEKLRPPRIEAVWPGDRSAISVGGSQFHAGSILPSGWRVREIGVSSTVFEFEGELITVEY
ncbi:hypothetical protein [Thalassococcus sp. S3]|uniref:SctD/MshK family protein n=1 Tax=Thalassococcus sp. S3 TaxID=2017482 RepID=UPI0010246297|nr:hypothetical protein [Thalassococcus sp. S3]QBF33395.1 hypothetical protein CFI11_19585 [Thalassococcus sp. S3]